MDFEEWYFKEEGNNDLKAECNRLLQTSAYDSESMSELEKELWHYSEEELNKLKANLLMNQIDAISAGHGYTQKNIKYKSKSKSGLNIYEFEYNWSPQKYTGVMAQEVKKVKPSAVSENIFGHMMVDYSQLDVNMERV